MVVHPEVSEIGPASQAVPISNGVNSPVFGLNYADTTIVVRDGDTACLGGLIRNTMNESVQKLPIVGDIPLIGLAFRSKVTEKKKSELIVLMTPHVVDDSEQLRRRTDQTRSKFVLIPVEMVNDELDRWTRGLDDGSAVKAYNRGTVYLEAQQIQQAVEELEKARDIAPGDAATRFNLGLAYAKKGDLDKAMVELNEAQRLDPRDAETHYNLGAILWRRQDYNGSAREFRVCLALEPRHEEAATWLEKTERALKDVPQGDSK